jgi:glucan 1,3-beta-glucosidase
MDNGSGGFMSDLVFNGGKYGAFFGNQQFTSRNMTFNGCQTAIFMNWNWAWTLSEITINNCKVGIDMANGGAANQLVGSVILMDSTISNTPIGISTAYSPSQGSVTNGSLVIDNVDFSAACPIAVAGPSGASILAGNAKVASFIQGKSYTGTTGAAVQAVQPAATKPAVLLNSNGRFFGRSKPQYENVPVASFRSTKAAGAKGDGVTDDTAAIQALFNSAGASDIIYFDHGAYVITNTIKVPKNIKITGEVWPIIMAGGTAFADEANPKAMFQVGQPGDVGTVEMSDLVFETLGPQPGAILVEWNLAGTSAGSAAMWDVHFRIGGSAGTKLQSDKCSKDPTSTAAPSKECYGAFMLLHITPTGSVLLENNWIWVADHELDLPDHNQIDVFNGRGVLIESQGPVWLYGTASEHSVLYNYQLVNASNIFMGLIQTETPYFQSNPGPAVPFAINNAFSDPAYTSTTANTKAWGLRMVSSKDIFVYGTGLYSFFDNYDQKCLATESCQDDMISIEKSSAIHMFGVNTKAASTMFSLNGAAGALDKDNRNNFVATVAMVTIA